MMSVSIFVSCLGITDLVNKIEITANLIKLLHFEIFISVPLKKFYLNM
jgi:hypothetical protein